MIIETLSTLTEPTKNVLEPVQRLNQQAVATFEKIAAHQIDSLKIYSELGVSQLKAAAEVRDVEGLKTLISNQTAISRQLSECLMSDFKAIFQVSADFLSQATKVRTEATPETIAAA